MAIVSDCDYVCGCGGVVSLSVWSEVEVGCSGMVLGWSCSGLGLDWNWGGLEFDWS